jgi:hypothetical protein
MERAGRSLIDDEVDLPGLLDGKMLRLSTFQDLIDIAAHAMILIRYVRAVKHQQARLEIRSLYVIVSRRLLTANSTTFWNCEDRMEGRVG